LGVSFCYLCLLAKGLPAATALRADLAGQKSRTRKPRSSVAWLNHTPKPNIVVTKLS
jgi:hypothetical protein